MTSSIIRSIPSPNPLTARSPNKVVNMQSYNLIQLEQVGAVVTVTLNQPEIHNAFNPQMIAELTSCFTALADDASVRVVVLTGVGASFCAGADLHWMRSSLEFDWDENVADAGRLATMFETINTLPKPLVGRVNGVAIGGGAGLVACCDIAIAVDTASFGFTEVKLGLVPAVISPFILAKLGVSQTRALFVTGARFDAQRALAMGLAHQVVAADALDQAVAEVVQGLLRNGPEAMARAKNVIETNADMTGPELRTQMLYQIAQARMGTEAQAGINAFLRKERPPWSRE